MKFRVLLRSVALAVRPSLATKLQSSAHDLKSAIVATEQSTQDSRQATVPAIHRLQHDAAVIQGTLLKPFTLVRADPSTAARLHTQVETFELDQLVQDVCDGIKDAAIAKGLSIEIAFSRLPLTVRADPIRIAQVLRLLVENAVRCDNSSHVLVQVDDFIHRCGTTQGEARTFKTRRAEFPFVSLFEGLIRFSVNDTGPSLPCSVFDNLSSGSSTFTSDGVIRGGGLAVIRDLLQHLGGTIVAKDRVAVNREESGTTFTVSLPAFEVQDAQVHPQGEGVESRQELHVLVVDELSDIRNSLVDEVRRLGHRCRAVSSAVEARSILASIHFDVILIDLDSTITGGLVFATEIRQDHGRNAASMLILTGDAENETVSHEWPFDGFLQTPISKQALTRLIGSRV